jgi:chemotaxis protein MotB
MADEQTNHPVIIVKKKKHGEHAHHGGAWKVAYADFVTAMMAFFLLLWLLNVTTEEQKQGIAQYFTPEAASKSTSGSGAILGGTVIAQGQMAQVTGGVVLGIPQAAAPEEQEEPQEDKKDPAQKEERDGGKTDNDKQPPPSQNAKREVTEEDVKKALAKREEEEFAKAEHDLRQAIQDVPELRQLAQNLIIDRTPEGMRIQLVDQGRLAMFPLGSPAPFDHTRKLLTMVAKVVQRMPNKVAVTGHTDATPYASGGRPYDNWELSTDRANSSRRGLLDAGLSGLRISRVVGKADQEPLFAENPSDPRNRRISIVLLREQPEIGAN